MSSILNRAHLINRQIFDPANQQHIDSLRHYLRTGNWGDIQFYEEVPFVEVPATVLTKYAEYMLGVTRETQQEREQRQSQNLKLIRIK